MPNGDDCGDTNGSRRDYFLKQARCMRTGQLQAPLIMAAGLFAIAAALDAAADADSHTMHYTAAALRGEDISHALRDIPPPAIGMVALTSKGAPRCQQTVRRSARQCGHPASNGPFCGLHKEWRI